MLGQGNFSKVFRVKCKFDGMEYAIKRSFRAVSSELEAKQWQQVLLLFCVCHSLWTGAGYDTAPETDKR